MIVLISKNVLITFVSFNLFYFIIMPPRTPTHYLLKGTQCLDADPAKAEGYFLKALKAYREVLPDEVHEDIASLYFSLGFAKEKQHKQEAADVYYDKALAILEKVYGVKLSRYSFEELKYKFLDRDNAAP